MAELVDASDSKSGIGNNVQVRFLFWAQKTNHQVCFFALGYWVTRIYSLCSPVAIAYPYYLVLSSAI